MVKEYYKKIKELGIGKLLLILLAGILLMLSCVVQTDEKAPGGEELSESSMEVYDLSTSVEEILLEISGVTRVKVLITYEDDGTKILKSSKNIRNEQTAEEDGNGGSRLETITDESEEYLYYGDYPYVISQTKPSVCGVLVVYKGDADVQRDLTEAVKVLTGVDYNRIKVVLMN